MLRRSSGAYVVFVFIVVLGAVSQAGAAEISLANWWDTTYTTYPTFDNAWKWVDYDIWHDGDTYQQIGVELAGYAAGNSFGWFDLNYDPTWGSAGYHQIFSGGAGAGSTATLTLPSGVLFDWYLHTPEGKTWHSNEFLESHPDPYFDHAWVFQSTNQTWINSRDGAGQDYAKAYLIAWEDLSSSATWRPHLTNPKGWHTNSEPDNNDMIVFFWTKESMTGYPVPEPGSLGLLALALCGAVAAGRKRWMS